MLPTTKPCGLLGLPQRPKGARLRYLSRGPSRGIRSLTGRFWIDLGGSVFDLAHRSTHTTTVGLGGDSASGPDAEVVVVLKSVLPWAVFLIIAIVALIGTPGDHRAEVVLALAAIASCVAGQHTINKTPPEE